MASINRLWHEQNRMPKNPRPEQRVVWHLAHAANCDCRPIPKGVAQLIVESGKRLPTSASDRKVPKKSGPAARAKR
jgi:hypothetical protein